MTTKHLPNLPDYTLQRTLGRGNSAWVYLALNSQGQRVALKVPFQETLENPERAERFANEVRLSLQLKHENLVIGYAGVPFGTNSFLAMRYFPESTLARWLELGRVPENEALVIISDVARALTFLHAQGVVHQDVKSQNVYLDAGRAALGDFGAAYFIAQGGRGAGSPFYMAPEIYRGELGTPASDVYSLCVLAYELLTGERPFVSDTYEGLMVAHLSSYPKSLVHTVSKVPKSVTALVERGLAKTAQDRPVARDFVMAIEEVQGVRSGLKLDEVAASNDLKPPTTFGRAGAAKPTMAASAERSANSGQSGQPERRAWWKPFKKRS
ncbi:serine/threonine-protein kinase [Deinococcus yavapaiensis]|uniref:Serine/threonine-protein kinase n=1 Tax=Deinococcus yavapaiensis KR-236 TaxID=694435 RepID=A0A318S1P4_9DEIO|nr:serine/threonine-protein kinase [Deinococcus yavapaiensis]PYE48700.1 serine/threonine-protein kinase [Deinococcus yavapaiensis KR-236]